MSTDPSNAPLPDSEEDDDDFVPCTDAILHAHPIAIFLAIVTADLVAEDSEEESVGSDGEPPSKKRKVYVSFTTPTFILPTKR